MKISATLVRQAGIWLAVICALLLSLHVLTVMNTEIASTPFIDSLSSQFDMDREGNIPTFSAALIWLLSAITSFILLFKSKRWQQSVIWGLLGAFFLYIAADEWFVIHERLGEPIRELLSISSGNVFYHAWVVPALGVVFFFGLLYLFLRHLKTLTRTQKQILGLAILLGASIIFMETIGTKLYFSPVVYRLGPVLVEEMIELGMASLILYKLLKELQNTK